MENFFVAYIGNFKRLLTHGHIFDGEFPIQITHCPNGRVGIKHYHGSAYKRRLGYFIYHGTPYGLGGGLAVYTKCRNTAAKKIKIDLPGIKFIVFLISISLGQSKKRIPLLQLKKIIKMSQTLFDEKFQKLSLLKWFPWVGKNYINIPIDKRILFVGESHYLDERPETIEKYENPNMTRLIVDDMGLNGNSYGSKFFINTHSLVFGQNRISRNEHYLFYDNDDVLHHNHHPAP